MTHQGADAVTSTSGDNVAWLTQEGYDRLRSELEHLMGPGRAEIAKRIGAPKAVRAVARACATNRIAVAIPCHRVIGSDGSLTGYRGGIERKRALLAKEAGRKFKLRP